MVKVFYKSEQSHDPLIRARGRGGGVPKKINTEKLRPEVQPLTLLYNIFGRKDTPFVYVPLTNGTPFVHLPNRKSSCHFHTTFNNLKHYSHKEYVFEIF